MRPLTAEDEAALRAIAERHGFYAARGPHTGEGSASRLIDALLAGEVVTLALTPADRRRLVTWLDGLPPPEGRLATVLRNVAAQLRPTLPKRRRHRRHAPRPPPRRRRPLPHAAPGATISRPTKPPAVWTSALAVCRSWPALARSAAKLTAAGPLPSARSPACRASATAVRSGSPSHPRPPASASTSVNRPHAADRSSSGSGRLTRADTQALGYLDQLLAEERRLEQTYQLPFRAPQRVATTVHACTRCGQDLLLLIFGDQAHDEEGLLAYERLMHEAIVACGLSAYVLGAPEGDGALDDTPSLLLQVWPTPGAVQRVTPGAWDGLLEQWSQAHCAPALLMPVY